MTIAVLSDLHANWWALRAVLDDARKQGVTRYLCLGDVVGYGPKSLLCFNRELGRLRLAPNGWVAGNHDWGLVGRLSPEAFREEAWWVLERTRELALSTKSGRLSLERLEEIVKALRTYTEGPEDLPGVWLMHGRIQAESPDSAVQEDSSIIGPLSYIKNSVKDNWFTAEKSYRWAQANCRKEEVPPRILLVGHTHVPMLWRRSQAEHDASQWQEFPLTDRQPVSRSIEWLSCPRCHGKPELCAAKGVWNKSVQFGESTVLANPGSIGQSRDGCPASAYAILDWDKKEIEFRRVPYRVEDTVAELQDLVKQDGDERLRQKSLKHIEKLGMMLECGGDQCVEYP